MFSFLYSVPELDAAALMSNWLSLLISAVLSPTWEDDFCWNINVVINCAIWACARPMRIIDLDSRMGPY